MLEIRTRGKQNYNDIYKFLNSTVYDFYLNRLEFVDDTFAMNFKAVLLNSINAISGVIKGTFNSSLRLTNVPWNKFKRMFPNICSKHMFKINNEQALLKCGEFLNAARNINAHSIITEDDLDNIDILQNIQIESRQYRMFETRKNFKILTMGGFIFTIFNFLREEELAKICKVHPLFHMVCFDEQNCNDYKKFVKNISFVNWEVPIREEEGFDLFDSVVGEYKHYIKYNDGVYEYKSSNSKFINFHVKFTCTDNTIKILKSSNTKTYYEDDYQLKIVNLLDFTYYSSLIPPFAFVDFLKESNIHVFDDNAFNYVISKQNLIIKLNYPKFYSNKNIFTLLLPEECADFRMINGTVTTGLSKIFMNLEKIMHEELKDTNNKFLKINELFDIFKVPFILRQNATMLRIFAVHGFILEDWIDTVTGKIKFTKELIVNTLKDLLAYFKKVNKNVYEMLNREIDNELINTIINARFSPITSLTRNFFINYPNFDKNDLNKKHLFIERTYFKLDVLIPLINENSQTKVLNRLLIKDVETPLYIYNASADIKLLNDFLEKNNLKVESKIKINEFINEIKIS